MNWGLSTLNIVFANLLKFIYESNDSLFDKGKLEIILLNIIIKNKSSPYFLIKDSSFSLLLMKFVSFI